MCVYLLLAYASRVTYARQVCIYTRVCLNLFSHVSLCLYLMSVCLPAIARWLFSSPNSLQDNYTHIKTHMQDGLTDGEKPSRSGKSVCVILQDFSHTQLPKHSASDNQQIVGHIILISLCYFAFQSLATSLSRSPHWIYWEEERKM